MDMHTFQIGSQVWTVKFIDNNPTTKNKATIDPKTFTIYFIKKLDLQYLMYLFKKTYTKLLIQYHFLASREQFSLEECINFAVEHALDITKEANLFCKFVLGGARNDNDGRQSQTEAPAASGRAEEKERAKTE